MSCGTKTQMYSYIILNNKQIHSVLHCIVIEVILYVLWHFGYFFPPISALQHFALNKDKCRPTHSKQNQTFSFYMPSKEKESKEKKTKITHDDNNISNMKTSSKFWGCLNGKIMLMKIINIVIMIMTINCCVCWEGGRLCRTTITEIV